VTVTDDGAGPPADPEAGTGHGLRGLRERAAALDALVLTQGLDPGFRLEVRLRG
jgi:two-component system, NarL family, sensor histidine kinase DesK